MASRPATEMGAMVYPIKLLGTCSRNRHQIKSWKNSFQSLPYERSRNKWHQGWPMVGAVIPALSLGLGLRHSFFQGLAVLTTDSFQQISLQEMPSATESHFFQSLLSKTKVCLSHQLRPLEWLHPISPLCLFFTSFTPHRCWSRGDSPLNCLHVNISPSLSLFPKQPDLR